MRLFGEYQFLKKMVREYYKKVGKLVRYGGHKTSCPLKIEDGNTIYEEDQLSIGIGNLLRD